jgi:transketolase N-terminal domain/subunit
MVSETYERLTKHIERMIKAAGSGHYASSMSALEIMYPLFYEQHIKPDQFILSKGHAAPALYAILFDLGYIDSIDNFRQYGGLPGHPALTTPGVLCSSGSLGMGISKAMGLAHANPDTTYHVLVGDGELQEGQNFEAMMHMAAQGIGNVIVHVDCNGYQYSGTIPEKLRDIVVGGGLLIVHKTKWQHDNAYLTKPKVNKKITEYSYNLLGLMESDDRIIALNADLEHDFGLTVIKETYPDRYIQCGISEQHMVSMAGGLARAGKIPVCHTFGAFYRRALDQMYNNCCDNLPVLYVAGLCGELAVNIGKSHESYSNEFYKILPGMQVVRRFQTVKRMLGNVSIYWEAW